MSLGLTKNYQYSHMPEDPLHHQYLPTQMGYEKEAIAAPFDSARLPMNQKKKENAEDMLNLINHLNLLK